MTEPDRRGPASLTARSADAARLHHEGVAANEVGQPARATRLLRRALALADEPGRRVRILVSLAHARAEEGHVDEGLRLLDEAEAESTDGGPSLTGLVISQRGLLRLRLGDHVVAREQLRAAAPMLRGEPLLQSRVLLNLGVAALALGEFVEARGALVRSRDIALREGARAVAAKAVNNLAYLDFLRGELPQALRAYSEARELFGPDEPTLVALSDLDASLTLVAAGLLSEADSMLEHVTAELRRSRLGTDEAQAWLNRAEVALADGRLPDARAHSRTALRLSRRRGSSAGHALAQALILASSPVTPATAERRIGETDESARALEGARLRDEARRLRLHVATRMLEAGLVEQAERAGGESLSLYRGDALRTRLMARTARARLAGARAEPSRRLREIRAGLADLQRHQARLGSFDLQTSVVRHGAELAAMGLSQSVSGGRGAEVFAWLERTRALAARMPPVRPPEDERMADLLEALRHLRSEARELSLRPDADPTAVSALNSACRDLERAAARRERQVVGSGDVLAETPLAEVRAALEPSGQLVALFDVDAQLHALTLDGSQVRLSQVGPAQPVLDLVRRVRADLDVLALASTPAAMRAVVHSSLQRSLTRLDSVLGPSLRLGEPGGGGPLVLVPTGLLAALPWSLLPSMRGRPISVARSAGEWLREHQWPGPASAHAGSAPTVFATGPRVARAEEEVRESAVHWDSARVLPHASAATLIDAAAGSAVLHVAAHGVHDAENPLFSFLELEGGLVFGHDLTRLHPPPRHVVLSACDLGLSTVRPGGEALGMTAALLHGGTPSVVAGVARVADDIACDVAVAYHQRLSRGDRPSYALAGALAETGADGSGEHLAPLTCFGAGW